MSILAHLISPIRITEVRRKCLDDLREEQGESREDAALTDSIQSGKEQHRPFGSGVFQDAEQICFDGTFLFEL